MEPISFTCIRGIEQIDRDAKTIGIAPAKPGCPV